MLTSRSPVPPSENWFHQEVDKSNDLAELKAMFDLIDHLGGGERSEYFSAICFPTQNYLDKSVIRIVTVSQEWRCMAKSN
jgi:hypothetical protein